MQDNLFDMQPLSKDSQGAMSSVFTATTPYRAPNSRKGKIAAVAGVLPVLVKKVQVLDRCHNLPVKTYTSELVAEVPSSRPLSNA